MKFLATIALSGLAFISMPSSGQGFKGRLVMGEGYAKEQIRLAIQAEKLIKYPTDKPLLATKNIAIAVAEPLLFSIYGKKNIVRQRPYEIYLIDGFWFITGTLPERSKGGTFQIIMEANTSRVIDVSHDK